MKRLMAIIITFALCVTIASYTNKKADELITNNTSTVAESTEIQSQTEAESTTQEPTTEAPQTQAPTKAVPQTQCRRQSRRNFKRQLVFPPKTRRHGVLYRSYRGLYDLRRKYSLRHEDGIRYRCGVDGLSGTQSQYLVRRIHTSRLWLLRA